MQEKSTVNYKLSGIEAHEITEEIRSLTRWENFTKYYLESGE